MMGISFVKSRLFSAAPEGTAVLFFIQIFATLGFAVLYSTLVLYATKHLQLSVKVATTLMGVFGAFNYGLHLFGGYLGGRFLSNRNLFVGGGGPALPSRRGKIAAPVLQAANSEAVCKFRSFLSA